MRIAILTPSRGRPQRFAEMVEAVHDTADVHVTIYLATDDDDAPYPPISGVKEARGQRKRLAEWTNYLARWALEDGHDVLGFLGDDHRPRTHGWDSLIWEAFDRMGSGLVYCADGLQDERLPTAPFWSADVIRALGWYYPTPLLHLYADNYWKLLADDLGRRTYLSDVLIEHMHPSAGKAEEDDSYRESGALMDRDRLAFDSFVRSAHPAVLARARGALGL